MERELILSPEPATTIAELWQWVQNAGTVYRRMTFGSFLTVWMREYMHALPPEWGYTVYWCHCLDTPYHGSRWGCESNGLSRSTLQRALLEVILLTSIRGIKNFTKRNALGSVNCNYLHEWIFGLPLNLKQFWINLIFIPPIFDCKPINWYQYENYKTYRFAPYR